MVSGALLAYLERVLLGDTHPHDQLAEKHLCGYWVVQRTCCVSDTSVCPGALSRWLASQMATVELAMLLTLADRTLSDRTGTGAGGLPVDTAVDRSVRCDNGTGTWTWPAAWIRFGILILFVSMYSSYESQPS